MKIIKTFTILLLALLLSVSAGAQLNVTYTLTDFVSNPTAVKLASLTPLQPFNGYTGATLVPIPIYKVTGSGGTVTFSNVTAGYSYLLDLKAGKDYYFTNGFPVGLSGNVNASTYNGVQVGQIFAFFAPQSTNGGGFTGTPLASGTNTFVRTVSGTNFVDIPALTFDPYGAALTTNQVASIAANITPANSNEVWISCMGTQPGLGTQTVPWVATNATQFLGLLSTYATDATGHAVPPLIPENTTIHLSAGLFHENYGFAMHNGWRIEGSGMADTTIILDPIPSSSGFFNYGFTLIGYDSGDLPNNVGPAYTSPMRNMAVENLTIDLNVQNQSNGTPARAAVQLTGDNALIRNVRVKNWGSLNAGTEQFLFVIESLGGNYYGYVQTNIVHNAVIDGCVVGNPAPVIQAQGCSAFAINGEGFRGNTSNSSATTLEFPATLSVTNGWIVGAEIRNCSSTEPIYCGTGIGQPAYYNFTSIGNYTSGQRIHNNICTSLRGDPNTDNNGVYGEQGPYQDVTIENNYFYDVRSGVFQRDANSYFMNNVAIRNNLIRYAGSNSTGIKYLGGSYSNAVNGLVIEGNNISHLNNSSDNGDALTLSLCTNVIVQNNYADNYGSGFDAGVSTNVSILRWFNNRNAQGTNLIQYQAAGYYAAIPNALSLDSVTAGTFTGNGSGLNSLSADALNNTTGHAVNLTNAANIFAGTASFIYGNANSLTNYSATNLNNGGSTVGQIATATATGVAWSNAPAGSGSVPNGLVTNNTPNAVSIATNSTLTTSNLNFTGTATGNGSGLTNLNASSLASGTVPMAQLPGSLNSASTNFTPTTVGWYRILNLSGAYQTAGTLRISGPTYFDLLLTFGQSGFGFASEISQIEYVAGQPASETVSQVRTWTDGGANIYLDIYVSGSTPSASAITLDLSGRNLPAFVSSPVVGATITGGVTNLITMVAGLVTSGTITASGFATTGTYNTTVGATGYTNSQAFDVRVFELKGTGMFFSNSVIPLIINLGTLSVNNDFIILHHAESVFGTGMSGNIVQ